MGYYNGIPYISVGIFGAEVYIPAPDGATHKVCTYQGSNSEGNTGASIRATGEGTLRNTGSIDGFRLEASNGGAYDGGTVKLVGLLA